MHNMWRRFMALRFLIVGGWNFVIGYAVFAGLWWAFRDVWPDWTIVAVSNVIGITNSFVTHRWLTFRSTGVWWREYLRFYAVYGFQALLNVLLIWIFVTKLGFNGYGVQFLIVLLLTVLSYWQHKNFSFRR